MVPEQQLIDSQFIVGVTIGILALITFWGLLMHSIKKQISTAVEIAIKKEQKRIKEINIFPECPDDKTSDDIVEMKVKVGPTAVEDLKKEQDNDMDQIIIT